MQTTLSPFRIRYHRKQFRINVILGGIWILFGLLKTVFNDSPDWIDSGFLVLGTGYLLLALWYLRQPYLSFTGEALVEKRLFNDRKLRLGELSSARIFAGDLVLKSSSRELRLALDIMEPGEREQLLAVLRERLPDSVRAF